MIISKILTETDTGENGSHQSGPLVPKEFIDFFPHLSKEQKNPRSEIKFKGIDKEWLFKYIYYNNKFFGGTRNEYRLTCTRGYFNYYQLKKGDEIILSKSGKHYFIEHKKHYSSDEFVIKLSNKWRTVKL